MFPPRREYTCSDRSLVNFSEDGATMSAATFRSLHGILSNPVAFLTFTFLSRLRVSPNVGILSENV